jgi:prepilin peptidase CpaA
MPLATQVLLIVLVRIAGYYDIRFRRIPNWLVLPCILLGIALNSFLFEWAGLKSSLLGVGLAFIVYFPMYLLRGMGAGDVKLMAALGAWLGMPLTFYVFIASSLAAGVYAVVLIVLYRTLGETWVNIQIVWYRLVAVGRHLGAEDRVETAVARVDRRSRIIPFAAMIALGIFSLVALSWMHGAP